MNDKSPYKRVIMILADGARPDVLAEEMQKGNLPHLSRRFAEEGTNATMITSFPSTTGPAYLPYLTGCFPGTCNVPGIRWFDKIHYAQKGWGFKSFRSYVGLESFLFNRDIDPHVKTAWEIFSKPRNILNIITKGLPNQFDLTHYSRVWQFYYGHVTDKWDYLDNLASRHLSSVIKEKEFDFVFLVFPSVDEFSHRSSPFSPRVRQAYAEIDALVGKIFKELEDAGLVDETLITIHSDHGLSETHEHFDIGPWLESEKKLKTFYYSHIFKFNFDAVSMVSGNGMVNLYFKGEKGWGYRKSFEEISHDSILLDELRFRDEIDIVSAQGLDGAVHILTKKGHGWFKLDAASKRILYRFDRDDPLGIFKKGDPLLTQGFTFDEALVLTFDTHYPDVFQQLYQVYKSPRAGDVIVTAMTGYDLRKRFEHPIHKASHGSLCHEHMKIPFLMNHKINRQHFRSVDVLPTVLDLLGKDIPLGMDGRSLV